MAVPRDEGKRSQEKKLGLRSIGAYLQSRLSAFVLQFITVHLANSSIQLHYPHSSPSCAFYLFYTMHLWQATAPLCLLASAALPTVAASAWGFTDASVAVQPKGAGINGGFKEQYAPIVLYTLIELTWD